MRFDPSALALPPPIETVKGWPLIGNQIYQFWDLASNNLQAALAKIAPYLKPIGSSLLLIAQMPEPAPSSSLLPLPLPDLRIRQHPH